ncbi:unnamed protein product, partial [Mesorhabditis spiculigera]
MLRLLLPGSCARSFAPACSTLSKVVEQQQECGHAEIHGWVVRSSKFSKMSFVRVHDGASTRNVQIVVPKSVYKNVPVGAAIAVSGNWAKSRGAEQDMELHAEQLRICATDENPDYEQKSADAIRQAVHLRARHPGFAAIMRLRSRLTMLTHAFFEENDYVHIDTPVLTSNDCEGAGETFTVHAEKPDYFGVNKKMFLSVSSQMHLEAMTSGIPRVYTIGSAFRADIQPHSRTHLAEFRMLEAEVAFCETLTEICDVVEKYMLFILKGFAALKGDVELARSFAKEVSEPMKRLQPGLARFPRITYDEALAILAKHGENIDGRGLSKANEMFLAAHFGSPVFVTNFPIDQKPFYMRRSDQKLTDSFDLLWPGIGEVASGGVREQDPDELMKRNAQPELAWYAELRRRGKPTSAGFGIGFDRLLQCHLGEPSIRDVIPFPRWYSPQGRINAQC